MYIEIVSNASSKISFVIKGNKGNNFSVIKGKILFPSLYVLVSCFSS